VLKPVTRQKDFSREAGPPAARREEDPAGSPYAVAAEEPHEHGQQAAREARDEVEPSDERFGHRESMRHLGSVLQRGASCGLNLGPVTVLSRTRFSTRSRGSERASPFTPHPPCESQCPPRGG
jgi:hypothetical protein